MCWLFSYFFFYCKLFKFIVVQLQLSHFFPHSHFIKKIIWQCNIFLNSNLLSATVFMWGTHNRLIKFPKSISSKTQIWTQLVWVWDTHSFLLTLKSLKPNFSIYVLFFSNYILHKLDPIMCDDFPSGSVQHSSHNNKLFKFKWIKIEWQ